MNDYQMLKRFGFSPFKAAEIALDAARGDQYALAFVKLAHSLKPVEVTERRKPRRQTRRTA